MLIPELGDAIEDDEEPEDAIDPRAELPLDEQIANARQQIANEPDFDSELAFDLVSGLEEPILAANRPDDLMALLDAIEAAHPGSMNDAYFDTVRALVALRQGKDPRPATIAAVTKDPTDYSVGLLLRELQYEGRTEDLEAALRTRIRIVDEDENDRYLGGDSDKEWLLDLILDRYAAHQPPIAGDDPRVLEEARRVNRITDKKYLAKIVEHASGRARGSWNAASLSLRNTEQRGRNLRLFSHEFACSLNARGAWPRGRVELMRTMLMQLIAQAMRESTQPTARELFATPQLDGYTRRFESPHEVAATLIGYPLWCAFLAERSIGTAGTMHEAIESGHRIAMSFTRGEWGARPWLWQAVAETWSAVVKA